MYKNSLPNTGYKKNDFTGNINGFIYSKTQLAFVNDPNNATTPVYATDEQAWLDAFKASNKNIRLFPVSKTFKQDHTDDEAVFETGSNNMQMYLFQKAGLFKFSIAEPSDRQISEFQKLNNKTVFVFFTTNKGCIEGLQRNADGIGAFEFIGYECTISVQKLKQKEAETKKLVITIQVQDPEEGLKNGKTIKPEWDVNRVEGVSDVVIRKMGVTQTALRVHVSTAEDFIGVEGLNENEDMLAIVKPDGSKTSVSSTEIGDGEYQIPFTELAGAAAGDTISLIDLTGQTDSAYEAVIPYTLESGDLA